MKVKNIMFSGVMGVILMSVASSANAATTISVASKAYVDTKAANVEAAYKEADTELATAINTEKSARETAVGALDERVTQNETDIAANAQEITTIKGLTGTEGVAKQIENALKVETEAREAAVSALQNKDTELAGDIADVDAKFADYTKTSDLNTTYVSETEMSEFQTSNTAAIADAKKAGTDASAALEAYKTTNDTAVAAKVAQSAYDAKVGELEAADTGLAEDIADVDAKFADYTKTADLDATFATNEELAAAKSGAEATAAAALQEYKTTNDAAVAAKVAQSAYDAKVGELEDADEALDGKITAMDTAYKAADTGLAEDIAGVDAKFADYTKTSDLDTTYVSETEMSEFQTSNTAAIADAKKAGTDASAALEAYKTTNDAAVAAKVAKSDYDAKVTAIENALDTKIAMPAACETQDCVLAINKASGTISWTPLTEPVADFINQQN